MELDQKVEEFISMEKKIWDLCNHHFNCYSCPLHDPRDEDWCFLHINPYEWDINFVKPKLKKLLEDNGEI